MIEFDWDDANRLHLARHSVTTAEAEELISNGPYDIAVQFVDGEQRLLEIGATRRGRILMMTTTLRGKKVRVVTAFDATRQWRNYYYRRQAEDYGTTVGHT